MANQFENDSEESRTYPSVDWAKPISRQFALTNRTSLSVVQHRLQ